MTAPGDARHHNDGFTLVELLITVLMAVVVFAAMVPLFANILKTTSRDTRRVIATNIAQQQLENVRLLAASPASYANITTTNLNSSTFNPTLIRTSYTPPAGGQPYSISTNVTDGGTAPNDYKNVTVTVSRPGDGFQTQVSTTIQDPAPVTVSSTSGPTGGPGPWSLTAAFKNYTEVGSPGVYVVYVRTSPTPYVTTTATPTTQMPSGSAHTCVWNNLPGGMNYLYTVYCTVSTGYSGGVEQSPSFHLLSNAWLKFDTNPGGS